jgi:hypothetical protein
MACLKTVRVVTVVVAGAAIATNGRTAIVGNAYLFLPLTCVNIRSEKSGNRRYVCIQFLQENSATDVHILIYTHHICTHTLIMGYVSSLFGDCSR